jgi:hypothetical protein
VVDELSPEEARRAALMSLLAAGLDGRTPRSVLVPALAEARRSVAALHSRGESLDGWLSEQMKLRGVRENAAVIAATELAEYREGVAQQCRVAYPERTSEIDDWLRVV